MATYSPIVISSCKGANLIIVKNLSEAEYPYSAYTYPVNNVLELRQNSKGILDDLKEIREQFDILLNAGRTEEAGQLLDEMENHYGKYNTEVIEARMGYDLETLLVE